jgi:hypothetical protein
MRQMALLDPDRGTLRARLRTEVAVAGQAQPGMSGKDFAALRKAAIEHKKLSTTGQLQLYGCVGGPSF